MKKPSDREAAHKQRRDMLRGYLMFAAVLAAAVILLFLFPERREAAVTTAGKYLREMILILPAVMVLMGLFSVFVSKELVVRHLGKAAGLKHVYLGNVLTSEHENTYCAKCSELLVRRHGYHTQTHWKTPGVCPRCGTVAAGVWK